MTKGINRNVVQDSDGYVYYRDFKNLIEARFLGDNGFEYFSKKEKHKLEKTWGQLFSKKDTFLFLASTEIEPFYKSAIIKLSDKGNKVLPDIKVGLNKKNFNFLYFDSLKILAEKYAFIFWGNYITSYPDNPMIESEKDSWILLEAQETQKTIKSPQKIFDNDISNLAFNSLTSSNSESINYLAPVIMLSYFQNKNLHQHEENYLFQLLSTYHSFLGNIDSATLYYNKAFNKKLIELNLKDTTLVSAKEKILRLAKENKIILINEAHTDIRNRKFLRLLLPDLYALGYKILAAEAVDQNDSLLNIRKYPVSETGFYTKEPVFASLIDNALSIGITVLGYDYFPDCSGCEISDSYCCTNKREEGQAKNISKIIDENQTAKILVFGGHDHIYKAVPQKGFKTMAMYLTEKGYTFASIDQVKGNDYFLPEASKSYNSVNDTALLPKSFTNYKADAYIIPPYPNSKKQSALAKDGVTILLSKPLMNNIPYKRYYLKVFNLTDTLKAGAIPIFTSEVKSGSKKVTLPLNKGEYLLQILSLTKIISQQTINVK